MTAACAAAALALLGTGTVFAAGSIAEQSSIGAGNAIHFAFADAGIDPLNATDAEAEFDYGQGQFIYDVEFTANNTEYVYWIKASNGAVVKKDVKLLPEAEKQTETKTEVKQTEQPAAPATISVDKAKETATGHAGLNVADVTFSKAKLDNDDGRLEYEIEFFRDGVEYEYTIDAVSGAILECKSEHQDEDDDWGGQDDQDDQDDQDEDDDWDDHDDDGHNDDDDHDDGDD